MQEELFKGQPFRSEVFDELERCRLEVAAREDKARADAIARLRAERENILSSYSGLDLLEGRDCGTMTPIEFSVVESRAKERHNAS